MKPRIEFVTEIDFDNRPTDNDFAHISWPGIAPIMRKPDRYYPPNCVADEIGMQWVAVISGVGYLRIQEPVKSGDYLFSTEDGLALKSSAVFPYPLAQALESSDAHGTIIRVRVI